MNEKNKLPVVKKKKKINLKEFVALAKRVRKSFEEQGFFEEQLRDENNKTPRFIIDP